MKKSYLLLSLLALALIGLSGCKSDDEMTGEGSSGAEMPYPDDSDTSGAAGIDEANRIDTSGTPVRGKFENIHFGLDSATVRSGDKGTLDKVASYLKSNPGSRVLVEGHCDERGTSEYNRALGQRRASAARDYLVRRGAPAKNVGTVSYGEDKPAGSGGGESAWAMDRRCEFVIFE